MSQIERLPTVFHESFALSRPSISQVLKALHPYPSEIDFRSKAQREAFFRENTQLGKNYVKSMPIYARGTGLVTESYALSAFGYRSLCLDPSLDQLSTQWLMHYHLCAPHGPGPLFWNKLVLSRFRSGDEFTQSEIADQIAESFLKEEGRPLSISSATSTANAFLETYVKADALGNLGILDEIGRNHYRVQETDVPPIWAVAAAILDYWQAHFPDQVTVNLSSLTTESGLASLFMISRSRLELILSEMREAGIVELFRVAPPYQVALLNGDPEPVLERMYRHEETA